MFLGKQLLTGSEARKGNAGEERMARRDLFAFECPLHLRQEPVPLFKLNPIVDFIVVIFLAVRLVAS